MNLAILRKYLFFLAASLFISMNSFAQIPAFPGAEGYAANITGGRGGVVFEVTTLEDDATNPPVGSLRAALKDTTTQPRTIVFRVGGVIELKGRLDVGCSNVTIAGQTAPGDGICLKNYTLKVYGKNIIIRYIRSRPADATMQNKVPIYGIDVENAYYVLVDHCSFSWSIEETCTWYDNHYTTLQWCIISEALRNSFNGKTAHGYAGVWGGQYASYHHNLLADCDSRNPRFNGARAHDTNQVVDYRNNVIYNWGSNSAYGGEIEIAGGVSEINMINNYYKYGPATSSSKRYRIIQPYDTSSTTQSKWYITGNYVDGYPAITTDNWSGSAVSPYQSGRAVSVFKSDTEFVCPAVTTTAADVAYTEVLAKAGATLPKRDSVDERIVRDAINRTSSMGTNGMVDTFYNHYTYPTYASGTPYVDSDHDGMTDSWEIAKGLNPNDPSDGNGDYDNTGYTNLEKYLNELVATNGASDVNNSTVKKYEFKLYNNYPNPFNPSTTIRFELAKAGNLTLKVYDVLGKEVRTLVDEYKTAGSYDVMFTTNNLPSGIYFCKLTSGNQTDVKKMLLLK
jgi:hypothetical protein